ncbi:hypothetical protein ACFLZX_06450 [Nanoarchaeota archaeon]
MLKCLVCKSPVPHYLEHRRLCPNHAKKETFLNIKNEITNPNFSSSSYSVFVGRHNYPNINVGILAPPTPSEDNWLTDAPEHWSNNDFSIAQITELRYSLINNKYKSNILDARKSSKLLEVSQELAMANKPAALDISLNEIPEFKINQSDMALPMGPSASLKNLELVENPSVNQKIERIVYDTDLKAVDGIKILYEKGISENSLSKVLSVGSLGLKKDRKLVPTRFSITAVDDAIGKELINQVKDHPLDTYLTYFGSYLGNYYLILFFPDVWSYELFEMYVPGFKPDSYVTDAESYQGRKTYADQTAGGYYTVRLATLEKLNKMKNQASVLALRFITDKYEVPLGVWVTREAARKTLKSKPIEFSSKELMLDYVKKVAKKKFNCDIELLLSKSFILKNVIHQKKLFQF